jgi:hypothetical protein
MNKLSSNAMGNNTVMFYYVGNVCFKREIFVKSIH